MLLPIHKSAAFIGAKKRPSKLSSLTTPLEGKGKKISRNNRCHLRGVVRPIENTRIAGIREIASNRAWIKLAIAFLVVIWIGLNSYMLFYQALLQPTRNAQITCQEGEYCTKMGVAFSPNGFAILHPPKELVSSTVNNKVSESHHIPGIYNERNWFQNQKRLERRRRTRPPSGRTATTQLSMGTIQSPWKSHSSPFFLEDSAVANERFKSLGQEDWSSACHSASLNKHSVVLVTGIATHALAAAFALLISKQCHVERIVGTDSLFPNLQRKRAQHVDALKPLFRFIPKFQFVPTSHGLAKTGPGCENDISWIRKGQNITHLVHFESSLPEFDSEIMSSSKYNEYVREQSAVTLQHILETAKELPTYDSDSTLPTVVHVTSEQVSNEDRDSAASPNLEAFHAIYASAYSSLTRLSFTSLRLPLIYGPLVSTLDDPLFQEDTNLNTNSSNSQSYLFVDNAIYAVLQAMQPQQHGFRTMAVSPSSKALVKLSFLWTELRAGSKFGTTHTDHVRQSFAWKMQQWRPSGREVSTDRGLYSHRFLNTYGLNRELSVPCISQCHSPALAETCDGSIWSTIQRVSTAATEGCLYVAYFFDLSRNLLQLPQNSEATGYNPELGVCRLAFVSGKSPVVQQKAAEAVSVILEGRMPTQIELQDYNGKISSDGWRIVWLENDDETTLNDADNALPIISPKLLFAETVAKALHAGSSVLSNYTNMQLSRIFTSTDGRYLEARVSVENRRGAICCPREKHYPVEPARKTVFFASEAERYFGTAREWEWSIADRNTTRIPPRQMMFYKVAEVLAPSLKRRPLFKSEFTQFEKFPYQWINLQELVHDLKSPGAHDLRCAWYDEFLYWGSNRNAEELSFAHWVGMMRLRERLGLTTVPHYKLPNLWQTFLDKDGELESEPDFSQVTMRFAKGHMIPAEHEFS